jgi:hypothetical protein
MTTRIDTHFDGIFSKVSDIGFLLESDPKLPSVCSIITGEPMRGSWWSHPLAQTIFQVNERLEDHPDVTITKLISGKVTFVHRKFWGELLSIGTARDPWQLKDLSPAAKALLKEIDKQGLIRTDQIALSNFTPKPKPGDVARELERKLLIHADQIHTESGAHAKILETWKHWATRSNFDYRKIRPDQAKQVFEEQLGKLNKEFAANATFPWTSFV